MYEQKRKKCTGARERSTEGRSGAGRKSKCCAMKPETRHSKGSMMAYLLKDGVGWGEGRECCSDRIALVDEVKVRMLSPHPERFTIV